MASRNFKKTKENSSSITKSILRNPEIDSTNIDNKKKRVSISEFRTKPQHDEIQDDSKILHEPRINKLAEMRKTLNEIKNYEARELKSMEDLSKKTQDIVNRAVSSKLNFPIHETVFKNLPPLSNDQVSRPPQKKYQKRSESFKFEEIQKVVREMVAEEYKQDERSQQRQILNLPNEDEYLGLKVNKHKEPQFMMPNRKNETQRYQKQMREELYKSIFNSNKYLTKTIKFTPPTDRKEKSDCRCLSDFYLQHSTCA